MNNNLPLPLRDQVGKKIGTVDHLDRQGDDLIATCTIDDDTALQAPLHVSLPDNTWDCDQRPLRLLD